MFQANVSAEGSYHVLRESGIDFARFLGTPEEAAAGESDGADAADETDEGPGETRPERAGEGVESRVAEGESEDAEAPGQVAEVRSSGDISKSVYASYFSAVGSTCNVFCFFFMYVLTPVLTTGGDYWISYWYASHSRAIIDHRPNLA